MPVRSLCGNMRSLSTFAICAIGLMVLAGSKGERKRYDNYGVYRLTLHTKQALEMVQHLESFPNAYRFLNTVHYVGSQVDVLVAPAYQAEFAQVLRAANVTSDLLEPNAQLQLDGEEVADANRRTDDYKWNQYHALNDTYAWMRSLAKQYPNMLQIFKAGCSYEQRDILGLKISYAGTEPRRAIFLEGGMHAREWIAPATTTYIAQQLLTSNNEDVRHVAEQFDWYIVPHANPDGFVYTHTTDRLWRKTRTPYANNCYGADPNRNWGYHWNEVGASNNPCSDTYAGPAAFSEIETRTLADFITTLKNELFLYVSFHAYSQLLLFPFGYTGTLPANYKDLKHIYNLATESLTQRHGTHYTGGNVYDAIYPAAGSTVDWAYGALNINYSYCYELRPSSRQFWTGFKLPANQIIPTGEETLDSLVAMVKAADSIFQQNRTKK